jgi:N-carbamoylputrescine amidase
MDRAPFTVALVQETASADRGANVERHVARIREARQRGAQIVCLPELFNAPYFCKSLRVEHFSIAEPVPGPTTERMQRLAAELEVVLVVPVYERQASGLYRNSAAIIDADGSLLGVYRKMHVPHDPLFEEKYYFTPGDADNGAPAEPGAFRASHGFRVWKTRYADIGVLICWDQWYPEGARITALLGAEILFYPTAIGWHPREKAQFGAAQVDAWRTIQRSHAIANGVFVAAPNRVGFEPEPGTDGLEFFGHSFVADPFGRVIAEAGQFPEVLVARCDPALTEETRRNWPFLRDRRVDAYGGILSRYLA